MFDKMPMSFRAKTAYAQSGELEFRDTSMTLTYYPMEGCPVPPASINVETVFRMPHRSPLNPQWWQVQYCGSQDNVHTVQLTFFGTAFSDAISNSCPATEDIALQEALLKRGTIVLDIDFNPGCTNDDGGARDIGTLHLELRL
jgi:hypothetical protein